MSSMEQQFVTTFDFGLPKIFADLLPCHDLSHQKINCKVISVNVTSYSIKISPCRLGVCRAGVLEGKQSGTPDSAVAVGQYNIMNNKHLQLDKG